MMLEEGFDDRTRSNMTIVLEEACKTQAGGQQHEIRSAIAQKLIAAAKRGKTTLHELRAVAQS
jgi:hypothetical protein